MYFIFKTWQFGEIFVKILEGLKLLWLPLSAGFGGIPMEGNKCVHVLLLPGRNSGTEFPSHKAVLPILIPKHLLLEKKLFEWCFSNFE